MEGLTDEDRGTRNGQVPLVSPPAPRVELLAFTASWSAQCAAQEPVLAELAALLAGSLRLSRVDVDRVPGEAERFAVSCVPAFVFLEDGFERARLVGMQPLATLQAAAARIL
ncbi:MAG: hypothetical protein JXR94_04150 [Candidatus Hydrogenedentes bacterium]|nr:hypothetical protein [Candidatus Hydrogenedentota bacterium]